jgi:hypothetical protein
MCIQVHSLRFCDDLNCLFSCLLGLQLQQVCVDMWKPEHIATFIYSILLHVSSPFDEFCKEGYDGSSSTPERGPCGSMEA